MTSLHDLSADQLTALLAEQQAKYAELGAAGLKLDLTRGKPSPEQLDLSNDLLTIDVQATSADGVDVRNYGGLQGNPALRAMFAELLNVPADSIIAGGNASLTMMHDTVVQALLYGVPGGEGPWKDQQVKFIAPVPGYDRHFTICAKLGIEMIPVELGEHGPDLDEVARLLADPAVKGMWAVPMYANPNGVVYDEATTRALLELPAAAPDFRIWWDNAYALHHLTDDEPRPIDVVSLAAEVGNPDRVLAFASTSKVTFAGAGVGFLATSKANLGAYLDGLGAATIGPDKVNQQRHVQFFGDAAGVRALMRRQRDLLAPKFAVVLDALVSRLGDYGFARWTQPAGGYFVSLDVLDGTATRVVELAKQAGIALTPAGASHPLGHDPHDRTIRIAPSFPPLGDLQTAMDGLATCALLAAAEKLADQQA
ncbi:aminotransferase class I/II-fold pyridoxal phosphate-dependent enzyme [Propionibacteriaceae bacterium Y1923]